MYCLGATELAVLSHDDMIELRTDSVVIDNAIAEYVHKISDLHPGLLELHGDSTPIQETERFVSEQARLASIERTFVRCASPLRICFANDWDASFTHVCLEWPKN